jgi:signal transduction histidine kinase
LYKIAAAGQQSASIDEFYQVIHASLSELIDVSNFYIAFYDEKKKVITFPYFVDEKDSKPDPVKPGKGMTEYVMNSDRAIYVTTTDIENLVKSKIVNPGGTYPKVWMGVPLKIEEKVVGAVAVQNYRDKDIYTIDDLKILEFVSNQIANAIIHKQEHEQIKISEERYRILNDQLYNSNQIKDLLLDIITHDLRNPAGVISGMAELLKDELPNNEMVHYIKNSSDSILSVITNATTLSKISIGEEIQISNIDLTSMIKDVVKESAMILDESGIDLITDLPDKLIVQANPIIIEVCRNFLSNAIKYGKKGKKILIKGYTRYSKSIFLVEDYGDSISREDYKNIFKRGFRLGKSTSRGSGLGLAIVKRIAEAHKGRVWGEPINPIGNRFVLEIPYNKN